MQPASQLDLMTYLQEEWEIYGGTGPWHKPDHAPYPYLQLWLVRTLRCYSRLVAKNTMVPQSFLKRYPLDVPAMQKAEIQIKYQIRGYNLLREMERLTMLGLDVFETDGTLNFLDLSSAACGVEASVRDYGHTTTSCDYHDGMGRVYKMLTDAQGIDVQNFDGSKHPFDFADKSFDAVTCFQAINFYAEPQGYVAPILDMCRIAKKRVFVIFNGHPELGDTFTKFVQENVLPELNEAKLVTCPDIDRPGVLINCEAA